MAHKKYQKTRFQKHTYGEDCFPEPLTEEKERYFLKRIYTEHREEAKEILIKHNLRLVGYIAEKYRSSQEEMEDLISVGTIGLIHAVHSYNPEKHSRLGAYASKCIENEIKMFLRGNNQKIMEISMEEVICCDAAGNKQYLYETIASETNEIEDNLERKFRKEMIRCAFSGLTEEEKKLIMLRYGISRADGKECTQKEVAEMFGVSQSYLSRMERKILMRMKINLI